MATTKKQEPAEFSDTSSVRRAFFAGLRPDTKPTPRRTDQDEDTPSPGRGSSRRRVR